ncbi:MAG TPA: aconitate hydratase, partial [Spirochaetia bacterium]|nr:aconitate hydratase [Spirochaetia bacterium]
ILESACGACIGMGFAPSSGGVSVRTFNRNFQGRSGTSDASVYLVSPETAAAAAIYGEFVDPTRLRGIHKADYSKFTVTDDTMIIEPPSDGGSVELVFGPNIKPVPSGGPVPDTVDATVVIKAGDNITTDHIMPAGAAILPLRSNIPEISKHVFAQIAPGFYEKALRADAGVIVGGENYGQGSSREHAALAPMYLKVRAVLAKSFARIHKANLVNFGIIPLEFDNPADYDRIREDDRLILRDLHRGLTAGGVRIENTTQGYTFSARYSLSGRYTDILLKGGLLSMLKAGA